MMRPVQTHPREASFTHLARTRTRRLATSWRALLAEGALLDGLTLGDFDGESESDLAARFGEGFEGTALTVDNVSFAVLAGCRARLLRGRQRALDAIRAGFVRYEDLQVQLAALPIDVLTTMLKGKVRLAHAR